MVVCLQRGADLHMAQLMPLPLTVSCFSKINIGLNFLVPANPGSPRKRAVKWVCVCDITTWHVRSAKAPKMRHGKLQREHWTSERRAKTFFYAGAPVRIGRSQPEKWRWPCWALPIDHSHTVFRKIWDRQTPDCCFPLSITDMASITTYCTVL